MMPPHSFLNSKSACSRLGTQASKDTFIRLTEKGGWAHKVPGASLTAQDQPHLLAGAKKKLRQKEKKKLAASLSALKGRCSALHPLLFFISVCC
jgi:hypothetical protein